MYKISCSGICSGYWNPHPNPLPEGEGITALLLPLSEGEGITTLFAPSPSGRGGGWGRQQFTASID